MSNYKIDCETVMRAAKGRWDEILSHLAPVLQPALEAAPKHVTCPIHGGEDGFRFFKDYTIAGSCICNSCGSFDGLHILMAVNRWNFFTALKAVNDFLKIPEGIDVDSEFGAVDGKVISAEMTKMKTGNESFCLRMSVDGRERAFWGKDLQRAVNEQGIQVGDNARVCRLGTKTFEFKGKQCRKTLWSARRLPSDEELAKRLADKEQASVRRSALIASKWTTSKAIRSSDPEAAPILKYFENRGIRIPVGSRLLRNLRFLASEPYYDDDHRMVGEFPCLIGAVLSPARKDEKEALVTIHKTYLTLEGQKMCAYGTPKKLMALPEGKTINGCGITFGDPSKSDGILCVAEGIETALSVAVATGYPTVATISANGMTTYEVPAGTKFVAIFADRDKSETGQKAALKLKERLLELGVPSLIFLPSEDTLVLNEKGVDWNDILRLQGPNGFPFKHEVSQSKSSSTNVK